MTRKLDIRIDEIIIDGSDAGSGHGLAGAIQGELSRLVSAGGLPVSRRGGLTLDRLEVEEAPEIKGQDTGVRLARAIYGGLRH